MATQHPNRTKNNITTRESKRHRISDTKTGNREPQQNYRLGTVSNKLLGWLNLVVRVQPHPQFLKWYKIFRDLKFRIQEVEGLYYSCRENKCADQGHSYSSSSVNRFQRYSPKPLGQVSIHSQCQMTRMANTPIYGKNLQNLLLQNQTSYDLETRQGTLMTRFLYSL